MWSRQRRPTCSPDLISLAGSEPFPLLPPAKHILAYPVDPRFSPPWRTQKNAEKHLSSQQSCPINEQSVLLSRHFYSLFALETAQRPELTGSFELSQKPLPLVAER